MEQNNHIIFLHSSVVPSCADSALHQIHAPVKSQPTILVVEDEEFVREVTRLALENSGYYVISAANAQEGIRAFEQSPEPIDLLLTDVVMPGMSGRELAIQLKQRCPAIKTIFMSGYSDNLFDSDGLQDATAIYLQKPFSLQLLTEKVQEALSGCAAPGQHRPN